MKWRKDEAADVKKEQDVDENANGNTGNTENIIEQISNIAPSQRTEEKQNAHDEHDDSFNALNQIGFKDCISYILFCFLLLHFVYSWPLHSLWFVS